VIGMTVPSCPLRVVALIGALTLVTAALDGRQATRGYELAIVSVNGARTVLGELLFRLAVDTASPSASGPPVALPVQGFEQGEFRRQFDLMPAPPVANPRAVSLAIVVGLRWPASLVPVLCGVVTFGNPMAIVAAQLSSSSCLLSPDKSGPMSRLTLLALLLVALVAGVTFQSPVWSQTPKAPPRRPPAELLRLSLAAETPGLAEPFKGLTTNGVIEPNLFKVRSTGVSTKPVKEAAETFLAGLTELQRKKTIFAVDDPEWRKWMNQSFYVRQGVSFMEMTPAQRDLAFALVRAGLSAKGLTLTRNIMRLNETLAELTDGNFDEYGEWQYFVTVMGTPSASEPWGWQLDGHHVIVNYFVLGDQVVVTPFFAGSEPVTATSGKYRGTSVLQDEQNKGLAFVRALDEPRRARAILKFAKAGDENLTEAWKDNVVIDYAGVRATDLSEAQRRQLLELVGLYVGRMDEGHARTKMEEVRAHLDRTYFAWIGKTDPDSVFYYRIQSPVIIIEFDHQKPVGTRHLLDPALPTRQHIHTVVRTPNGNDYGKDLLRQHYAAHPH